MRQARARRPRRAALQGLRRWRPACPHAHVPQPGRRKPRTAARSPCPSTGTGNDRFRRRARRRGNRTTGAKRLMYARGCVLGCAPVASIACAWAFLNIPGIRGQPRTPAQYWASGIRTSQQPGRWRHRPGPIQLHAFHGAIVLICVRDIREKQKFVATGTTHSRCASLDHPAVTIRSRRGRRFVWASVHWNMYKRSYATCTAGGPSSVGCS